uniref:Peptidoglycan recognition protein 2 n=1 Tax=Loxodonta africana TaxID=9785 RepID=G3T2H2_LOXAF
PHRLSPELRGLTEKVAQHDVRDGREYGVVLAPDGSTVAVQPLLAGLEAGLQGRRVVNLPLDAEATSPDVGATVPEVRAASPGLTVASPDVTSLDVEAASPDTKAMFPTSVDSLLAVTLATDLGLTFLQDPQTESQPGLGAEGCWDQFSAPQTFTLLDPKASRLTTAFLNGALDGILLGDYLSRTPEPQPPLSLLLSQYYGAGVAREPGLQSNFRRQNGAVLTSAPTLTQQGAPPFTPAAAGAPRRTGTNRRHASCMCITHTFPSCPAPTSRNAPPTCAPCRDSTRILAAGATSAIEGW